MGMKKLSILIIIILVQLLQTSSTDHQDRNIKTEVFLSPKIVLEPGLVSNKYYNIDFPRGHIALKSFNAEVVDDVGNPVPLHEVYLHHWLLSPYYAPKSTSDDVRTRRPSIIKNSGVCDTTLTQYYGLGAETRRTATDIPYPYGIEVGNPASFPAGFELGWRLNVHVIDTRGTEDPMACTECWCGLYNVTTADEEGLALPVGYDGGVMCCRDGKRCRMKTGFEGMRRSVYMRYTVKYAEWDATWMIPVKVYILDVTDVWTKGDASKGITDGHSCVVEYDVKGGSGVGVENNGCIDSRSIRVSLGSRGGDVIYGVGHQHAGATATALYGQGGREICSSYPKYGEGREAGDEAGFVVGMSTCYPSPDGPVKISPGETLTLVSNYSCTQSHAGVMGLFYLLIAESSPPSNPFLNAISIVHSIRNVPNFVWPIIVVGVIAVVIIIAFKGKRRREEGYEAII